MIYLEKRILKIQTVEAVREVARNQIAEYLNAIPQAKTEPPNLEQPSVTNSTEPVPSTEQHSAVEPKRNEPHDTPGEITPQRQDKEQIPKEIFFDGHNGVLFIGENFKKLTPTEKVFFERFWDKGDCDVEDIISHMTTFTELKNTIWSREYFGKALSSINKKGASLGVEKLIKNVERNSKMYRLSVKVKRKTFKS